MLTRIVVVVVAAALTACLSAGDGSRTDRELGETWTTGDCGPPATESCRYFWVGQLYECTANVDVGDAVRDDIASICWSDDGAGNPLPSEDAALEIAEFACAEIDGCEITCVDQERTCVVEN